MSMSYLDYRIKHRQHQQDAGQEKPSTAPSAGSAAGPSASETKAAGKKNSAAGSSFLDFKVNKRNEQIKNGNVQTPQTYSPAPRPASSPVYSSDGAFFPKKNPYEGTTTRRPNPFENVPYSDPLTRAFSQQTGWRDPKAQALYELAERVQAQKDQSSRKNFAANDPIGQMGRGNIDLYNRPQYKQPDGSLSTVNSISIGTDEGEVLIPTIGRDSKGNPVQWTDDEAIDHYFKTGEYLGKFKTPEEADRYAEMLHNQQEAYYSTPQQPKITPASTFRSGPLADIGTGPRSRSAEAARQASEAARDALDQAAAGVRFNRTEAEKRRRSNAISLPETETADDEYSGKMEQRPEWLGGQSVGEYMRDFMNSQEALGTYGADVVREYNRIYDSQGAGAAQEYVMSKDSTGNPGMERIDAFLTGVGNASGINSIAGIAMGPENYRRVASEQQSISKAHPIASAAGSITGTLPLITTLGKFARAIPAVAGLSKAAQAVISGAAAMGGSTAIQEAGAAANGLISPGRFVGDVAVSGLAGIAGGALGNTVSQKGMQFLYNSGLINNSIARTVVAGLSGSGYSVGSTGVREASEFIRDPENYEADPVRIIKDASVAFAFGAISYIANGGTRFTMNEEASNERPASKWFEDCSTPQEVDAKLRQYARQYHPDQPTGDADLFSEISAEATAQKAWMNVNAGAQAYQKAQEAYSAGNADAYQEAKAEYEAAVNALVVDVQSGAIQGQEAVEAIQVLQAVSENLAGSASEVPGGAALLSGPVGELADSASTVAVPQDVSTPATASAIRDVPGNPYSSMTADQRLAMVAREMMAPANRPESEANAGVGVEAPSTVSSTSNTLPSTASSAGKAISMAQHSANAPSRAITLEDIARSAVEQKVDTKDAQRQAIVDVAQNLDHENLAAAMENATMLTEAEKQAAFREGVGNAAIEMGEENRNVAGEPGGYLSGEGSRRPVSLGAGEPVGGVRTQAGRVAEGWKDWSHSADSGIKRANVQISGGVPAEKIIRTAEPGQVIYKVESGHTPSMRKAAAMVRTYDPKIELVPFVSGNDIRVTSGETARAFVDPERRSIGYRANDERAAGDQLARHELIELGVIDGKVDLNDALKHLSSGIREFVDDDIISDIADVYLKSAVNDVGSLSPEALSKAIQHANKEMLCDIGAGINQFDGVDGFELYAQVVDVAHDILHDYMNEKLGGAFDAEPESIPETKSVGASQADVGTALTVLKNTGISVNDNGTVAHMEYSTRYSWKTRGEQEKAAAALQKTLGVSKKKALGFIQSEMSLTNMILRPGNVALMDYTPDDRYTALKKNSDYPQGTFDFNNNCRKRVPFTTLFDRIQMRNPNRLFTADDLEIIRQNMIKHNYPVACALCYVEERRQKLGEIADSFVKLYENDAVLDRFVGKTPFEKMKAALESVGDDPYKPTIADLVTYEGLKKLEKNHKGIADAFRIFNNARGMQSGRLVEGRAEYKRELLTYTPAQVKRVNDLGGIRVFSYSDFEAVNLLDLVQIIQDAASKGIMIQAYTKVPAFAKVVRNTGIKLNRSLIAAGTGVKYENGKKVLDFDPVEGININDPDFFDSTDDRDVGNILVGMSDEQIRLAMASPFVDYIIPFHTSLPGTILKAKKIDHWKNYKLSQTDKDMKTGKNAKNINIYTEVLQAAAKEGNPIKNKKDFVNKFLQVAKDKNLIPRFSEFLNTDKDGNFVYTEGYHKFLIDFKLFDKNGNIVEQQPVRPVFDDAYNTKLMEDFANGVGSVSITDELYRDTVDALNAKSEGAKIQYSSKLNLSGKQGASGQRDSSGKALTTQQAEYFKDSKIRDEDGNLLVVYHGTSEDFNVFDSSKGRANMDIRGSFFSPWDIDAEGYGPNVKTVYLNIKNPAPEGVAYKALNMFKGQNNAGVKAREYLIRHGYDGVNNGNEEYIAFYPEQIKNIDNANPTENEDIRYSSKLDLSGAKDSSGKTLTAQQAEYFKDSKARDAEGRLLTLYHGTEFAGFTEFKTERGVWLTTSKRDADSYGGNWEGKVFDPNEKPEIRRTNGKTYPVGEHMRFETEEDRDNFLKEYPDAESYLTERELRVKEAELEDDWEADDYDERSEELQELRKRSEKIGRAYARYELKHSGSTTIGEMLEDPSLYSLNDFKRVWLSIDREVSFDDEFEYYDSDEEYRDAIAERLRNYIEEGADDQEWHDEMLNDFAVKARIPEGKAGEIFNNTNNRTYELYANVVNPYVFDNHGRGSEFNGTFYHTIEEAMADPQYDGVIVENARVGRYQDLGTVVLVKNPNQVKLTSNENPTENDDIRYSSKLQLQQKRDEDYSAAIRENDTETAARLVKEAAEAAGYTEDIYHGTGAFGFTKFDLGKMDDGASIFATTDSRVAESYSGETKRELISQRGGESADAIIDRIDGAKDEDLLPLIKENLDPKYKRVPQERLAEMRDERVNDIRFYADKIMDFMDDNPGMFDEAKSIAASRLASSMYKLSRARSADEVDEYLRQYNDDAWELKFMDESAFYEMFDGSSGIAATNNAIRELNTLLESDVMFTNGERKPGSTLDVLTPGEARTRLIGEMSKGIYHLYGKNENMLEFDANGDNWNMINTDRIGNKAFRIKSTSNKDKAWLSGLYMPYNDAQSLAARAARDANGEDDYLDVKDLRDPLGRISGWEFRSHKTGEMVMELESALPSRAMTRDIAKYAREVGYDGVIMRNLKDSGGATAYNQPSDVYIYFKPNAVKSADTVTYDDGGNAIPLSERFKTGEDDIRYSSKLDLRRKQERDNEYMDAVNTGDIAKAAKMVSKAAEEAGFKNAIPEQTLAYKVRTGKAPTKTKKVYKVFTVAPDGSPTALFVSGTQKLPQGVWLDAQDTWHFTAKNGKDYVPSTQNPYTEGGKTGGTVEIPNEEIRKELIERGFLPEGSKAKSVTALAYRPGWHAGDLPFFPQGGKQDNEYISESNRAKANKEVFSGTEEHPYKNYHRYNQVVFECEMAFDKNYTKFHIGSEKGKASYGKVVYEDMQEMPVDGGYKFATNPMANANDIGSWFISGSLKIGRALSQEECDTILRQNGRLPQLWEQGKLDLASLGYTGPQKDAARKTLAPVTYDDEGNVIPLSARFDPDVDDVRYSSKLNLPDTAPTFYSKLQREIEGFKGNKIGAASVESYLKGKGVKDEEIKWSGIRTYLEGKKSVDKAELLQYLRDNELQIDMRMLTENDTDYFEDGYYSADADEHFETLDQAREYAEQLAAQRYVNTDDVRMEDDYGEYTFAYTDETGEEVTLLTVEEVDPYDREKPGADSTRWREYKLDGGENYREVIFSIPGSGYTNQAMSTHWGPENPGILAHARIQDFETETGDRVLFVEEIQSDWHNAGQKKGYAPDLMDSKGSEILNEIRTSNEFDAIAKQIAQNKFGDTSVKSVSQAKKRISELFRQYAEADSSALESKIAEEVGVKRLSRDQADIVMEYNSYLMDAIGTDYATPDAPFRTTYTDYVLKNLLRMAAEGDYDYLAWTTGKMQEERWSDEFAEGYRIEYDQQIPKFLKKYGKQWGAGLGEVWMYDAEHDQNYDVPAIKVNELMKQSVLTEGQPMFSTKLKLDGKEIELTEREEKLMEQLNEGYLKRIEQVTVEKDAQIEKLKEQMKAAVGAEKQKAREQIAKIRKEKNERIAYLEKQWRQNTNWQIAELKKKAEAKRGEEHDDMIRRLAKLQAEKDQKIEDILANHRRQRQEARDRRNDRKLRVKFQKLARKALRESQNKPGLASERVQELLKDIDLTALGMRDDTRTSLHNKLLEIMEMRKTDENYLALHAEQDWKKVERLFKKQIKDMSLEEVNDLITELSALCHYQETTDRLIKDEQNRTAAEVGRQIVKDLKELTPLDITNPVKVLSAKYLRDNLSPDRAFNRLSGYKRDSAMRSLYRQVLDGYTKVKEFEKKSDELFDGFRNDPKNKEFLKNGAKQTIPVTSKYGQTALISPAMRVSLYMASRNRDNLRHISTDGMTVPEPKAYAKGLIEDAYGRGTTIVLDPVDVNKVCANMTESEKEFASLLETFFDGYAKEAINDTSVELDGILKAIVDHYFPIASDKNFLAKSMDSFQDPTLEGWNNLKARQENANNKILLEDARQVLQRHIRNTARYYGLAIPMRNWNKVYGYTSHRDEDTGTRNSVQSAIKNAWNSDTADYIERLIRDDINSGGRKAERGVMDSMRSAYAGATLTLNAGVALKQTTSYFMAGSILDMESLMYGLSHKFKKADQEYMDSITPWGWARRQGESTIELGEMARRRDPITRNTPNWNQAMDVLTTNALFTAAERSIQKDYPDLKRGDKKYDDALAERYNQVLWRTQPQYESAFRPEYLRKTDIGSRTFGMFKTESMQMSGELIDAWGQWKADEKRAKSGGEQEKRWKSESSKQFYKTFASWLASNMCFAMMGTALDIVMFHKGKPYRNERGEVDWQTIAAKTGENFIGSALGGYFFAGTAFSLGSYLFNIINGEKATWYDIEVPGISLINDMVTNTGNWVGTMIDEEASPSAKAKATSKFVLSASKFTPLGFAGNLLKLADSLNLYIQDIREGIKTGDWHLYEAGDGFLQDTSPTKDQYANQAVYYAGQGNAERAGRALKRTKTGNLEKALGRKIGDAMFSRFTENPQDLVSYMETISKNGGTPKLSDVPDRGFSSFTKLKEGLGSPNRNENWHHIVEQQQGPGDNNFGTFSSTQINNANNVISIPSGAGSVHKAITDYYDSVQDFTDGMTVREWLAENKTFEEQFDFGIEQLRKYGEVAPTERGWVFIPNEEKINAIPLKEGKDKELTATQKQWDTMMAEAREDGGLTDREIRAAALQMLNEGVPKDEVIELYKSKKNDKYIDEWMKYDGESGGDLSVYFGFMNAKSLGNQDGAAEYLNESGLPDEDKWALWELVNWSEASYDKLVE